MGDKVICQVCLNQTNGFCSFKKTKVKLKKRRLCDKFKQDMSKVKAKESPPTIRRPEWFWDKEEKRRIYKEELKRRKALLEANELKNKAQDASPQASLTMNTGDVKHPLTGDLSRFKTTALKEDK